MHTSVLAVLPSSAAYEASSVADLVLGLEPVGPPGAFAYSNVTPHLIAPVVERVAGEPLHEVAAEWLFRPLGITRWHWRTDASGLPLCMAGLCCSALDLARIGSLFLTGGLFAGRAVLPTEWVERTRPTGEIGIFSFTDYEWVQRSADGVQVGPPTGFGHTGDYGQHLTVQPRRGVAAVRLRTTHDREDSAMWGSFAGAVSNHLAVA